MQASGEPSRRWARHMLWLTGARGELNAVPDQSAGAFDTAPALVFAQLVNAACSAALGA